LVINIAIDERVEMVEMVVVVDNDLWFFHKI
jgi:hypothetical protein